RGNLAHHLRPHVLELVFELDLLGGGYAVLGDAWCAKRLVEHDVAALGAERHAHRVGENIDTAQHAVASVDREFDFLGSHVDVLSAIHLHPEERQSGASRNTELRRPYSFQRASRLQVLTRKKARPPATTRPIQLTHIGTDQSPIMTGQSI